MDFKKKEKQRKGLLIITPGLPYPPVNGFKLKIYNLILQLRKYFDIHLIIISNEKINNDAIEFLESQCVSYTIFKFSKIQYLLNLFKAITNKNLPFQVAFYDFKKVSNFIINNINKYDYVLCNLIRTAQYAKLFPKEKVMLDIVDSIGINYLRSRKNTYSLLYKYIYTLESIRLIRFEKNIISKLKCTFFVNKEEADYYRQFGNVKWLPNGVNESLFEIEMKPDPLPRVCFLGSMFYQPNIDAVLWFIKFVLPKLDDKIHFYIIGSNPPKEILKLQNKRVIVTGFLEDPYKILAASLCTVAPMQTGAGIQNKILESMALGQITVTTDLGANPIIGSKNNLHILIANTPKDFAEVINDIYYKPHHFNHIRNSARDFVKLNYSWDLYGNTLADTIFS